MGGQRRRACSWPVVPADTKPSPESISTPMKPSLSVSVPVSILMHASYPEHSATRSRENTCMALAAWFALYTNVASSLASRYFPLHTSLCDTMARHPRVPCSPMLNNNNNNNFQKRQTVSLGSISRDTTSIYSTIYIQPMRTDWYPIGMTSPRGNQDPLNLQSYSYALGSVLTRPSGSSRR